MNRIDQNRSYDPRAGRQQSADRLVHDRAELVSVLGHAAAQGSDVNIRLARDILLPLGFTIPSGIGRCQINGGNAFAFRFTADIVKVITIAGATRVLLLDLTFSATASFNADVLVSVTAPDGLQQLALRNVKVAGVTDLLDRTSAWSSVNATGCAMATASVRNTAGVGSIQQARFTDCVLKNVSLTTGSQENSFVGCSGIAFTSSGGGLNSVIGCQFDPYTLVATDVVLPATVPSSGFATYPGLLKLAALAFTSTSVTLTGTNPTLTIGNRGYVRFELDIFASGNLTLTDGAADGHQLVLFCSNAAAPATLPDNTANNVRLSAAWIPTSNDTLTLIWDATDSNWIELSRSAN